MSHAATNWAIQQRGLNPATKILLWHLADRHNRDTKRCDPSQDLLAHDSEMHRATVNRHLKILENRGLLRRVQRICTRTKKQLPTSYELAFDHTIAVSQIATRAVSQLSPIPCRNSGDSRVANCDTNLVREPVREPCASEADPQTIGLPLGFVDRFLSVYPRPGNLEKTEGALLVAVRSGATLEELLASAKAYASEQDGNERRYVAYSENWVSAGRWRDFSKETADSAIAAKVTACWVDAIKKQSGLAAHCSARVAYDLVLKKLVSREQCLAAGIAL